MEIYNLTRSSLSSLLKLRNLRRTSPLELSGIGHLIQLRFYSTARLLFGYHVELFLQVLFLVKNVLADVLWELFLGTAPLEDTQLLGDFELLLTEILPFHRKVELFRLLH